MGIETNAHHRDRQKGKTKDKGWACDLTPKPYTLARYFAPEQAAIEAKQAELEEDHSGENAAFSGFESITVAAVKERVREIGKDPDGTEELKILRQWQALTEQVTALKKKIKALSVSRRVGPLRRLTYGAAAVWIGRSSPVRTRGKA